MWSLFFFFQAEDGIRDGRVTGVQTCALPIYAPGTQITSTRLLEGAQECLRARGVPEARVDVIWVPGAFELPVAAEAAAASRSEERRVGKGGRARWGACP